MLECYFIDLLLLFFYKHTISPVLLIEHCSHHVRGLSIYFKGSVARMFIFQLFNFKVFARNTFQVTGNITRFCLFLQPCYKHVET